jgi:hypothetical protein
MCMADTLQEVMENIYMRQKLNMIERLQTLLFPFICSNIPAAPAYRVYISHLIQYSRACGSYHDFLDRVLLLTRKLLNQKKSVTFTTMTLITVMEYMCNK